MSNDLNTILDQDGGKAAIEKYLYEVFLEREVWETPLANTKYAKKFRIPMMRGQYVEFTRKNTIRTPQKLSETNPTSDPASGAGLGVQKQKLPIEFLQEYVGVGQTAQLTTWWDLEEWAKDELQEALLLRQHQLMQNAFLVGRMLPGVWAADGTAATGFDAAVQATAVSMFGTTFTFDAAPKFYAGGKEAFNSLEPGDRATFTDLGRIKSKLALAGAKKIDGLFPCWLSTSMADDLAKDDKYFAAMVNAFKGEGLKAGMLTDYKGYRFILDDKAFTEEFGAENVRAANGQVHAAIIAGKNSFAYLDLGDKRAPKPKFKVQDISKTGVEKTIGYLVPGQQGIIKKEWCAVYKAPVSEWTPNG